LWLLRVKAHLCLFDVADTSFDWHLHFTGTCWR